jgi:Xaa-Pro aminopeptidase
VKDLAQEYLWMLNEAGISTGRVSLYGREESGQVVALVDELKKIAPEFEFIGEFGKSILMEARATKEEYEIDRIRTMGKVTTKVVGRVADLLTSRPVRDSYLLNSSGEPLRVGEVKSLINLWLAEEGAENPEGTIFSIGRDAGVPHSVGNPEDIMELGKTIVFDIFPCEAQGGYFYDFTRTWCLGYADTPTRQLYTDVKNVYDTVINELKCGQSCKDYQNLTCDLFEKQGHPTIRSIPGTQDGYVHSLGHGLGLDVHEQPWFSMNVDMDNKLEPGSVFTIEPGLYYPDRGMGVRLEDTYHVTPAGDIEILADYPMDLVLPVKK